MRQLGWLFALIGVISTAIWGLSFRFMETPPTWANVLGGAGIALIGLWLMLDWKRIQELGEDQTSSRIAPSIVAILLVGGIAVTLNIVGYRYNERWDLTEGKQFTLADQSIDIVKKLDREVEVVGFFMSGSPEERSFRDLMDRYKEHTTLLKVELYDPQNSPLMAEQMKITSETGTVLLKVGEREERLETDFGEETVTNAIVRVTSDRQHSVCLVEGHGEVSKDDTTTAEGLGFLAGRLDSQNYTLSVINLLQGPPAPATCEVVILGAPQAELLPMELDRLAQYVAGGGQLIALLDPRVPAGVAADMARYGIRVGTNVVVEGDPYRQVPNNPFALILTDQSYDIHPITQKLKGGTVFMLARSVDKGDDIAGLNVQVLARTSEQSWAEVDFNDPSGTIQPDPGRDVIGKVPVIAAAEVTDPSAIRTTSEGLATPAAPGMPAVAPSGNTSGPPPQAGGKIVVFGDADFAGNQMIAGGLNQDLILNTIAWMVGEESQISIRANEAGKGKLEVDGVDLFIAFALAVLVGPGITLVGAVGTWVRRRKL